LVQASPAAREIMDKYAKATNARVDRRAKMEDFMTGCESRELLFGTVG
jgi:hypothetical protein